MVVFTWQCFLPSAGNALGQAGLNRGRDHSKGEAGNSSGDGSGAGSLLKTCGPGRSNPCLRLQMFGSRTLQAILSANTVFFLAKGQPFTQPHNLSRGRLITPKDVRH